MPKQPIQEVFSQGLVTSRPAHMLAQGELVRADHCVYRENNIALQRAPDHNAYSLSSPAILGTNTINGILMGNFEAEEYPDQLICRAGNDLFSSNITGLTNNTFELITSPGRVLGTFSATPRISAVNIASSATTITPAVTGGFDGIAVVGRAIYTQKAFPLGQTTLITNVTESGGHVTSITVNIPAVVEETSPFVYFAPKCDLGTSRVTSTSIGFSVIPTSEEIMVKSAQLTNCKNVSGANDLNRYYLEPATATQFNAYAAVGTRIAVEADGKTPNTNFKEYPKSLLVDPDSSNAVEVATVVHWDVGSGNVTRLYLDKKIVYYADPTLLHTDLKVTFVGKTNNIAITAVEDVVEEGSNTPVYSSCYFNWFPPVGQQPLVFSGGLARNYTYTGENSFDGMSWDGTMFLWDGVNTTRRLEYRARKVFNGEDVTPKSIVARPAGLLPVVSSPKVTVVSNNNSSEEAWNRNLPTGVYWLLVTEAYIPVKNQLDEIFNPLLANNLLESAYLASNNIAGSNETNITATDGNIPGQNSDPTKSPIVADASGHAGRPIPFGIGDVARNYITITLPAPRNDGTGGYMATHWCVYIAGGTNNYASPPPFSSFTRTHVEAMTRYTAGQVITLKDSQRDRIWGLDSEQHPGVRWTPVHVKGFPNSFIENAPGTIQVPDYRSTDTVQDKAHSRWNTQWVYTALSGAPNKNSPGAGGHADFVISDVKSGVYAQYSITGIRVGLFFFTAWGRGNNGSAYTVDVGTLSSQTYNYTEHRAQQHEIVNYGGVNDTWGLNQTDDWASFRVRVSKMGSSGDAGISILAPVVTIYYATTTINFNGPAYRCVTYRSQVGAVDISDPSTLPPPRATMGDSFQGSLVLNDTTNPSFIRYSLPDQPERFPQPYRMKMGTKRKGKITALKTYKQILIVGMERTIKRVNYLPKETDTDFTQGTGLSVEEISSTHGIVGPNAITDFDMPGMGPMIAYVSTIGLRMTNGSDSRALNTDVLLKDYIHPDHWSKCILKAFPNQKWLVLYYVPKDSTHGVLSKCFFYSYSEDHIKGGATIVLSGNPALTGPLPVTGPCDCFVTDACDIVINSSPQVATTDGDFIYIEDANSSVDLIPIQTVTGPDDATKVNRVNVPYIKTRDIFPAGFTQEANIGSVYLMHETKGNQYVVTGTTSTQGSTTLTFNSGWGGNPLKIGQRVIHGGWDSPPSVLSLDDEDGTSITVSAPAVRAFTGSATFDTGVVLVRVNAAQFSEDEVPILTEYRSTSVGVGQPFIMDATANRFSMEIIKTENPNTGDLNDLQEDVSIIGIVYHASPAGETNLHAN